MASEKKRSFKWAIFVWVLLLIALITLTVLFFARPAEAPQQQLSSPATGNITKHASGRYFQDAQGNPVFLLGYYAWAAVNTDGYEAPAATYVRMIDDAYANHLNYIRISLGETYADSSTSSKNYTGVRRTPFAYVNGKADLDQWDPKFWEGLRYHLQYAKDRGVIVHVAIFDGWFIAAPAQAWPISFWNIDNQVRDFYGDLDLDMDNNVNEASGFFRLDDFNNNTGVGYYQKKLIDKTIEECAPYDNVFYELGNEINAPTAWADAMAGYIREKSPRAISQVQWKETPGTTLDGLTTHAADTYDEVKRLTGGNVGKNYVYWEDTDGPELMSKGADDNRKAVWYAFAGGSGGWTGFTGDYWKNAPDQQKMTYYKYLSDFISTSGIKFWQMPPDRDIVSNSGKNSCLYEKGSSCFAYILNDESITLNLKETKGKLSYQTYNTKTGEFGPKQTVKGGAVRSFERPAGAEDWAIYVWKESK